MAGPDDIVETIKIEGTQQAAADLEKLGDSGQKSFEKIGDSAVKASADISKIGQQEAAIKKIGEASYQMGSALRDAGEAAASVATDLVKFGTAAVGAIAGATAAMVAFTKKAANATDAIRDASIAAGVSAKEFQKMAYAADQNGASMQSLQRAFALINSGGKELEDGLKKFNVRLKESNGDARSASAVFKDVADVIKDIHDPVQRASAAAQIFGRRLGPGLVELLSQGSDGIEEFGKQAEKLGIVLGPEMLKVGDDFNDAFSSISQQVSGLATRVALQLAPAFIKLFDGLSKALIALDPIIMSVAKFIGDNLLSAVTFITEALTPFQLGLAAVGISLTGMIAGIGALAVALGPVAGLLKIFLLPITTGASLVVSSFKLITTSVTLLTSALRVMGLVATAAFGPWGILIAAVVAALAFLAVYLATNVNWEQFWQRAMAAWNGIVKGATDAVKWITDGFDALGKFFVDLWASIGQGAQGTWDWIVAGVTATWELIVGAFTAGVELLNTIWEAIKQAATDAWNFIRDAAIAAFKPILDFINTVIDGLKRMWDMIKKVAEAMKSIGGGGGAAGAEGFARGGYVRGPGTGTSDSILARLSDGEYVMRQRAVNKYGVGLMNALNNLRIPLSSLRRFANGGFVNAMQIPTGSIPRFATGGEVRATSISQTMGRPINLSIGGETFHLVAPDTETGDRVVRFATQRSTRSLGRKPNYYGAK